MQNLLFDLEWWDAPGVIDVVESKTWARLSIRLSEPSGGEIILNQCIDYQTGQVRNGTFGSIFPLVRWLVQNYWSLLHEVPTTGRVRPSRRMAAIPQLRPWIRRHSFLTAREGYALPDLTMARDGDRIVLQLFPDPLHQAGSPSVRFLNAGTYRVDVRVVEQSVRNLVTATLDRLQGTSHPDVVALRSDWEAIIMSDAEEGRLCRWAAKLGLDPYDDSELTVELEDFLGGPLSKLASPLRTDLLDSSGDPSGLAAGYQWLVNQPTTAPGVGSNAAPLPEPDGPAHLAGYRSAQRLRNHLVLSSKEPPAVGTIASGLQFPFESRLAKPPAHIDGFLTRTSNGPTIFGDELPYEDALFRWARGLYAYYFNYAAEAPRLLTRSHARLQRESRAFAAELLAPASAIRNRLPSDTLFDEDLTSLAQQFNVRPSLIRHQVENHNLAILS